MEPIEELLISLVEIGVPEEILREVDEDWHSHQALGLQSPE
ncbi:hypothetical protein [Xenorhabdus szentirmaii]|nr:hypothetical protein [Xenorhabdus sp. 5]